MDHVTPERKRAKKQDYDNTKYVDESRHKADKVQVR